MCWTKLVLACVSALLVFVLSGETSKADALISEEVLIFYANETPRDSVNSANYVMLFDAIRKSGVADGDALIEALEHDATVFPKLIEKQANIIADAARTYGFNAVIFTNALARKKRFRYATAAGQDIELSAFQKLKNNAGEIWTNSPLAQPEYFRSAIKIATGLAEEKNKDVVLITTSHGDEKMAMMPRVVADLSNIDQSSYVTALQNSTVVDGGPIAWISQRGISKKQFWQELIASTTGRSINLVAREACRSGVLSYAEYAKLPSNVNSVVHFGKENIKIDEINYASLFAELNVHRSLSNQLSDRFAAQGAQIDTPTEILWHLVVGSFKKYWAALLYVPLLLWLIGLFKRRRQGVVMAGLPR